MPRIMKIGGSPESDKCEQQVDPNVVVIGIHTGLMQGQNWEDEDYLPRLIDFLQDFTFDIITIDRGSFSWLPKGANLELFIDFCLNKLNKGGLLLFEPYGIDFTINTTQNIATIIPGPYYAVYMGDKRYGMDPLNFRIYIANGPLPRQILNKTIKINSVEDISWHPIKLDFPDKFKTMEQRQNFVRDYAISYTEFLRLIM